MEKDFITVADVNISGIKWNEIFQKLPSPDQNRHIAAHSNKVQAALEMCGNVGSANSVDASVGVDCVFEVA